ncbi:MAG TPA: hypothetical protein VJ831_11780 [Jatrophihabitantaceae bacterium]|nr:hypothetical protein [Jatrophihabitantaceae bacterium]
MHGRMQRAIVAALALTLLGVLGACTSTVNGKGVALGSPTASGTATGFPSDTTVPSPSGGASGSISTEAAPGGGLLVTYPDGHFKAVFPEEPETQSQPGNLGPVSFTVYIASVQSKALAAAEDFTPHITQDDYDATLKSAVSSFVSSSGLTLKSEKATTFKSYQARATVLTSPSGSTFDMVVFMYQGQRLYILFGEQGDVYDTLTGSFQILS